MSYHVDNHEYHDRDNTKQYYNSIDWSDNTIEWNTKKETIPSYAKELPIIIGAYGTLRNGMGNSDYMKWCGGIYLGTRRLRGYSLWCWSPSIIPYARPDTDDESIIVDLFLIDTIEGIHALDRLEGTPSHYVRTDVGGFSIYVDANANILTRDNLLSDLYYKTTTKKEIQKIPNGDYASWFVNCRRKSIREQIRSIFNEKENLKQIENIVNDAEWIDDDTLTSFVEEVEIERRNNLHEESLVSDDEQPKWQIVDFLDSPLSESGEIEEYLDN